MQRSILQLQLLVLGFEVFAHHIAISDFGFYIALPLFERGPRMVSQLLRDGIGEGGGYEPAKVVLDFA